MKAYGIIQDSSLKYFLTPRHLNSIRESDSLIIAQLHFKVGEVHMAE